MATILGINMGVTQLGKKLKDGGACLVENEQIRFAIAEERLTRSKHDGGFSNSVSYCLEGAACSINDLDLVVVSSTCEPILSADFKLDLNLHHTVRVNTVSHHLSHAYSAFIPSPFEEALIVVMDAGGNIIGNQKHGDWWNNNREQNTYFVGQGNSITKIGNDFASPLEAGFGEVYRYFTYYLGWRSQIHSGKTMGLAPYGNPEKYNNIELFSSNHDGALYCRLVNDPPKPIDVIKNFCANYSVDFGESRRPDEPITQQHMDIAFFVQDKLEKILIQKINQLCNVTGMTNLCLAGGVALNCVANRKILDQTPIKSIFIQPAAGDTGQCLGNALYGAHAILGKKRSFFMNHVYWGKKYELDDRTIEQITRPYSHKVLFTKFLNITRVTAEKLAAGKIVAWFQGASEFGPRALGHRSILIDPRNMELKDNLNIKVKKREWFRPFAPSVLIEDCIDFFDIPQPSPFMLLTANVRPEKRIEIPAVVHVDGTARLQTISKEQNGIYYDLVTEFKRITGIPILLNTSFNMAGEPIVETPSDAINCFMSADIDCLVLGDYLIQKT